VEFLSILQWANLVDLGHLLLNARRVVLAAAVVAVRAAALSVVVALLIQLGRRRAWLAFAALAGLAVAVAVAIATRLAGLAQLRLALEAGAIVVRTMQIAATLAVLARAVLSKYTRVKYGFGLPGRSFSLCNSRTGLAILGGGQNGCF
jgi:hypothetical protein